MNLFESHVIIKYVGKTGFGRVCLAAFIFCLYAAPVAASFQYIDENGCIKGALADVIGVLKIDLSKYKDANDPKKSLPINYISHAYNFLKLFYQNGNYQGRQEFYRNDGKPDYCLSKEQALKVLQIIRGQLALHKPQDPKVKMCADAVICSGADWSLEKRIFSFEKFLEAGFNCNNVFLLSRTLELEENVKRAIERHKTSFNGKKLLFLHIPYAKDSMTHENLLAVLKSLISKEFYLISDPEYAGILLEAFTKYGEKYGLTCLGEFVRPITSDPDEYVRKDIVGYKFNEFIPNEDNQFVAAAYMSLGQLGYQVMQEVKLYSSDIK
jgi:hypothetical protein